MYNSTRSATSLRLVLARILTFSYNVPVAPCVTYLQVRRWVCFEGSLVVVAGYGGLVVLEIVGGDSVIEGQFVGSVVMFVVMFVVIFVVMFVVVFVVVVGG